VGGTKTRDRKKRKIPIRELRKESRKKKRESQASVDGKGEKGYKKDQTVSTVGNPTWSLKGKRPGARSKNTSSGAAQQGKGLKEGEKGNQQRQEGGFCLIKSV